MPRVSLLIYTALWARGPHPRRLGVAADHGKACLVCKENGPKAHLLWILVFDDQHNQVGLMNLQVIVFVVQ